jgi:hypothetical protein
MASLAHAFTGNPLDRLDGARDAQKVAALLTGKDEVFFALLSGGRPLLGDSSTLSTSGRFVYPSDKESARAILWVPRGELLAMCGCEEVFELLQCELPQEVAESDEEPKLHWILLGSNGSTCFFAVDVSPIPNLGDMIRCSPTGATACSSSHRHAGTENSQTCASPCHRSAMRPVASLDMHERLSCGERPLDSAVPARKCCCQTKEGASPCVAFATCTDVCRG